MFPYDKHATIAEVDAFMSDCGITIIRSAYRDDVNAPDGHVLIRSYYLPHSGVSGTKAHPAGLLFTTFEEENRYGTTRWHQRKMPWFDELSQHLQSRKLFQHHIAYHREYQLLDHVAGELEKAGYPRTCAAYTAWLYGTHAEAQHAADATRILNPTTIKQYAAIATDTRLNDRDRHELAANGISITDLNTYLDTGASYGLIKNLLSPARV